MNSSRSGKNILTCSISSISELGFWVIVDDKEYFVPFEHYPEFRKIKIEDIFSVKMLSPNQLHWEKPDIDIELMSLEQPEKFPLHYLN